jgi:hypothetical protein
MIHSFNRRFPVLWSAVWGVVHGMAIYLAVNFIGWIF